MGNLHCLNSALDKLNYAVYLIKNFLLDNYTDVEDLDPRGKQEDKYYLILRDCVTETDDECRCLAVIVSTKVPIMTLIGPYLRREWPEVSRPVIVDHSDGRRWAFKKPTFLSNGSEMDDEDCADDDEEPCMASIGIVEVHPSESKETELSEQLALPDHEMMEQ